MARQVQSQSGRSEASFRAFIGLLANAVFWLVVALVVPIQAFLETIPEVAPYAHWAPLLFYVLAFLSFARAVRALLRLAVSPRSPSIRQKAAGSSPQPARPAGAKGGKSQSGLAVTRAPTVQRMR